MSIQTYPRGLDCVWIAFDRAGHAGAFITAGEGPIPEAVLESSPLPIEDIESRVCQLPVVSSARVLVPVERPDSFIDLAERGFYVFDWTDVHRTHVQGHGMYEPVAVPARPIAKDLVSAEITALASGSDLTVDFGDLSPVDVCAELACVQSSGKSSH